MNVKTMAEDHGLKVFLVALFILIMVLALTSCGSEKKEAYNPVPPPKPVPADPEFQAIQPLIKANCGGCHNGTVHPLVFDTAAKFKAGKAKARILNGSMPPSPKRISDEDKTKLLAYLNG